MNYLTEPLIPKGPVDWLANQVDKRSLEQTPMMARLKGFGAGALEGLRSLTSPLQLAAFAAPYLRGSRAVAEVPAAMEGLAGYVPAAEYVAQGGEEAYNAARALPRVGSAAEDAFKRYASKPWRMPMR